MTQCFKVFLIIWLTFMDHTEMIIFKGNECGFQSFKLFPDWIHARYCPSNMCGVVGFSHDLLVQSMSSWLYPKGPRIDTMPLYCYISKRSQSKVIQLEELQKHQLFQLRYCKCECNEELLSYYIDVDKKGNKNIGIHRQHRPCF